MPEQLSLHDQAHVRLQEKLRRELGPTVLEALAEPAIIEIVLNPDGRIWVDELGVGMRDAGVMVTPQAENLLGTVAATLDSVVTRACPILEGELPIGDCRFCGLLPPVVTAPTFCIRKAASHVFTLSDYARAGIVDGVTMAGVVGNDCAPSRGHAQALRHAIAARQNVLIAGGTQSGKTTLTNALLGELNPTQRVVTIEETRELRCSLPNAVSLRTTDTVDINRLVRTALRLRPDRIIVGEVRGAEALAMLKAWNTGHPGGIATLHANDAHSALIRLEQLIQEANVPPQPALIAQAVDLIVVIVRTPAGRKVTEVARVLGVTSAGYQLESIPAIESSTRLVAV